MSDKGKYWMGCDISKATFFAALADMALSDQKWVDLPYCEFELSKKGAAQCVAWLKKQKLSREQLAGVCIEASGCYSEQWVELMRGRVGPVSIVNPIQPKRFREMLGVREKNDRVDAAVCALFGRFHQPHPSAPPSDAERTLREQNRLYLKLDKQLIAFRNRLSCAPKDETVHRTLRTMIKTIEQEMKTLKTAMEKSISQDDSMRKDSRNARTIPGVGARTIQVVLGEFGDLRKYTRNQLASLAGLYPKEFRSGSSVHKKPRLAKGGGGRVRKALYMATMSACTHNPHMRIHFERLVANGKKPMEAIGAVMRKLLLLIRAVVISGAPYDPAFGR